MRRDRNGQLFSEKWAADKNGEWCYGTVTFVHAKKGRHVQRYRVKYDEGAVMQAEDAHLEHVHDESDSEESASDNEFGGSNAPNSQSDADTTAYGEEIVGFRIGERDISREAEAEEEGGGITEDSEGKPGQGNPGNLLYAQEPLRMGDTVKTHGKIWKRVEGLEEDTRTEPEVASKFSRLHYNESTREVDIFLQLMPRHYRKANCCR